MPTTGPATASRLRATAGKKCWPGSTRTASRPELFRAGGLDSFCRLKPRAPDTVACFLHGIAGHGCDGACLSARIRGFRLQGHTVEAQIAMTLVAIILATLAAGIGSVWVAALLMGLGGNRAPGMMPQRLLSLAAGARSEERRVGEEGRSRWAPDHLKK